MIKSDCIIVGGGASGLFAAALLAQAKISATVIEKNDRVGKKLLATGNGKCNFSNQEMSLSHYHGKNSKRIWEIIQQFPISLLLETMKAMSVFPTVDSCGRYYPHSNQASSVLNAFRQTAKEQEFISSCCVTKIEHENETFSIHSDQGLRRAKYVILATGSPSSPSLGASDIGLRLLQSLGFTTRKFKPCLCQLRSVEHYPKSLEGVRVKAKVSAYSFQQLLESREGELQFTSYGVTGIVIYDLSRLFHAHPDVRLSINFFPHLSKQQLLEICKERQERFQDENCEFFLNTMLHKKIAVLLLKLAGIKKMTQTIGSIQEKELLQLVDLMQNFSLHMEDTLGFTYSQISQGGLSLDEIDKHCMTKKINNLYVCGEILDVIGDCGGYNLHFAFASAYCAVSDIINKINSSPRR